MKMIYFCDYIAITVENIDLELALKFITALSPIVLGLGVLLISNFHNRKTKARDQEFELDKIKAENKEETVHTIEEEKRIHQKEVYASLLKILFDVQSLHIDLSGNCVDYKCIDESIAKFKSNLNRYQDKIAENQIYLSAEYTNALYGFYRLIGELLIELKDIREKKKFHLAIASVQVRASELAMNTITFSLLENGNSTITEEMEEEIGFWEKYSNFINCCGEFPDQKITQEYVKEYPQKSYLVSKLLEIDELESRKPRGMEALFNGREIENASSANNELNIKS